MAKILIVDDSLTLRTHLRQILEDGEHEVVDAYDGVNGLEVLKQNENTQLIICDVNMPEMDGITMCSNIHKDEKFNKLPIFMLTTESSPELKAKGKSYGVIAWITKPVKAEKTLKAITKVLSR